MESNNVNETNKMTTQVVVKQETCLPETVSTETPFESETTRGSDVHMKNESPAFASVFIPDIQDYEIQPKVEVKEEPDCLETDELKSESEEFHIEDSEGNNKDDEEYILPESTRLGMEAVGNNESGVTNAGLDKHSLKLRENSHYDEKSTNTAQEDKNTDTFRVNDKMSYKCKYCEKSFKRASHLEIHIVLHEGIKTHKCNICGKTFMMASHLKRHNLKHEGIEKHKCKICDKTFAYESHLKNHIFAHEGIMFKCDECDKSFTHPSQLKSHKLIHKELYKCESCKKSFSSASNLRIHSFKHEGKRPFKCNKCNKSFPALPNLKSHAVTHEDRSLFSCSKCDKSFLTKSYLKTHNLMHDGIKPFKCDKCGKTFYSSSNFKRHALKHEKV